MIGDVMSRNEKFYEFVETITKLRDPKEGCPWDIKQTHETLIKYFIEETFEVIEAIESKNPEKIKDELGDVLLQIVLHSVIAKQNNHFSIDDVIYNINEKMKRRHPHVFDTKKVQSIEEVTGNWEKIKKLEEGNINNLYTFDKKYLRNNSLICAVKIGEKTNKVDFDWDKAEEVFAKVEEELAELKLELENNQTKKNIEEEFGDLLFSLAQLGRHLNINPELSLRKANQKFILRFCAMEDIAGDKGLIWSELDRAEKEKLWDLVKKESND